MFRYEFDGIVYITDTEMPPAVEATVRRLLTEGGETDVATS